MIAFDTVLLIVGLGTWKRYFFLFEAPILKTDRNELVVRIYSAPLHTPIKNKEDWFSKVGSYISPRYTHKFSPVVGATSRGVNMATFPPETRIQQDCSYSSAYTQN